MEGQFSDAEEDSAEQTKLVEPLNNNVQFTISSSKSNDVKKKTLQNIKTEGNGENNIENDDSDEEDEDDFYSDEEYWNDDAIASGRLSAISINGGLTVGNKPLHPNRQMSGNCFAVNSYSFKNVSKFQPSEKHYKNVYASKINVDKYHAGLSHSNLSGAAVSAVLEQRRKEDKERYRVKDKSDRATIEQVMDPRTRMILFKLLNRGFISNINGCISTGKEANVYHCTASLSSQEALKDRHMAQEYLIANESTLSPSDKNDITHTDLVQYSEENSSTNEGENATSSNLNGMPCNKTSDTVQRAIKIYKTSILVFKDRDKYVSGEFRFRGGYGKNNPRKMVRTWAEKEMRNLTRLWNAGIDCPKPVLLRSHVLLMDFLGTEDGWPAPRLHDADLSESKARELYWDMALNVRKLYHKCKLVHGDLSEYNLLLHKGKAFVIDVSQSVEHDHPNALEFLRKDIHNLNEFFKRRGVNVLTVKEMFDFVVDVARLPSDNEDLWEEELSRLSALASKRTEEERSAKQEVEEEVFKQIFIPRSLVEVGFPERDIADIKSGKKEEAYQTVTGVKIDLNCRTTEDDQICDKQIRDGDLASVQDSTSDIESSEEESDGSNETSKFKDSHRPRNESPNSRKERKKSVREEKAEKRENKTKKHIKKRREKVSRNKIKK